MFGIDSTKQREMMDESLGVIMRLFKETEPFSVKGSWFELNEASLQLRGYQEPHLPVVVASVQSPAGVTVAGKHGAGVISLSVTRDMVRKTTLKDQWTIAEESAAEHGQTVDRNEWRLSVGCHLAESRKEAFEDIRLGSSRVVTEYFGNTLGHEIPDVPSDQIVDFMTENNQWIVGTPDDCIAGINRLLEASGGFGGLLIRVEDWAPREKILKSYELLARYVMPQFQGSLVGIQTSNQWAADIKDSLQVNRKAALQAAETAYQERQ